MQPVLSALGHVVWKALHHLIWGMLGTTILALVLGGIWHFLAPVVDAILHRKPVSWDIVKSGITWGDAITVGGTWLLLFVISLATVIYRDHEALVAKIKKQDATIENLNEKLYAYEHPVAAQPSLKESTLNPQTAQEGQMRLMTYRGSFQGYYYKSTPFPCHILEIINESDGSLLTMEILETHLLLGIKRGTLVEIDTEAAVGPYPESVKRVRRF